MWAEVERQLEMRNHDMKEAVAAVMKRKLNQNEKLIG